jgi:hypothetical protein
MLLPKTDIDESGTFAGSASNPFPTSRLSHRGQEQQSILKQQPSGQTCAKISFDSPSSFDQFNHPALSSQSLRAQERQRLANMVSIGAEPMGDSQERYGRPFKRKQQLPLNMVGSASLGTLSSTDIQQNFSSVSSGSAAVSTLAQSAGFEVHLDKATVTAQFP